MKRDLDVRVCAGLAGPGPADVVPMAVASQDPADVGEANALGGQGRLDGTLGRAGHTDVDQGGLWGVDVVDEDGSRGPEGASDRNDPGRLRHGVVLQVGYGGGSDARVRAHVNSDQSLRWSMAAPDRRRQRVIPQSRTL